MLFPAPFGPITPTASPSRTVKSRSRRAQRLVSAAAGRKKPAGHRSFQAGICRPDEARIAFRALLPGCPGVIVLSSDHVRKARLIEFEEPVSGKEDEQADAEGNGQ